MNQKERMLAGLPYQAWKDGLAEERQQARQRTYAYNLLAPDKDAERDRLIREILGRCGKELFIEPPFRCDYGTHIQVGENFYANFGLTVLDVAPVIIGNNVMFGPNVSVFTAGHPLHPDSRNSGYEYGISISIGDNVWIGGNTVINPGVHIGNNAVIGSGSVVTKDIPDNAVAAGNPCRVLRFITEADREFYYKDRKFDINPFE